MLLQSRVLSGCNYVIYNLAAPLLDVWASSSLSPSRVILPVAKRCRGDDGGSVRRLLVCQPHQLIISVMFVSPVRTLEQYSFQKELHTH